MSIPALLWWWLVFATIGVLQCTSTSMSHAANGEVVYNFAPESCVNGRVAPGHHSRPNATTTNGDNDLRFNFRNLVCEPSLGLTATSRSATVRGRLTALLDDNNDDDLSFVGHGVSFSLWFRPNAILDSDLLTVAPEARQPVSTQSKKNVCQQKNVYFQLSMQADTIVAAFQARRGTAKVCGTLLHRSDLVPHKLTHVVVVLNDRLQSLYVNGVLFKTTPYSFSIKQWKPETPQVRLFGDREHDDGSFVNGPTLYQFTTWNRGMSSRMVWEHFARGLPPVPPIAFDHTLVVNEDAERTAASHPPEWYQWPTRVSEAALLPGPRFESMNLQAKELVTESMANHSVAWNYNATSIIDVNVYLYVTQLPTVGSLYFQDGTLVSLDTATTEIAALGRAPIDPIAYIPPHNQHSVGNATFTNFSYCVASSPIEHRTQCESSAVVTVTVRSVNDPPLALSVPPAVAALEGGSVEIPLHGWDVDPLDEIVAVEVTDPPLYGTLALSVSTFRKDFLPHDTLLADLNYRVSGDDKVYVQYTWSSESWSKAQFMTIHGHAMQDVFRFRVYDSFGAHSSDSLVNVTILSSVIATAETVTHVLEDSIGDLAWYGRDESGFDRRVGFLLEKIPSSNVGVIIDRTTNATIRAGELLDGFASVPYEDGVRVGFVPRENFCHEESPGQSLLLDNKLRFRAVALVNGTIASMSDPFSQRIHVDCMLDVIALELPTVTLSVLESSLKRLAPGLCDDGTCSSNLTVPNIFVRTRDRHAHKALVSVSSTHGYLSFNDEYWNRTEPVAGRRFLAQGIVSFYALPMDLQLILQDLQYQSLVYGSDSIRLVIEYGNCSSTELAVGHDVRTSSCHVSYHTMDIDIVQDVDRYKSVTRLMVDFPWHVLFCLLVYPLLYVAVFCLENAIKKDTDDDDATVSAPARFIRHTDENGMHYYEDTQDGSVRWELPHDEDFVDHQDWKRASSS